MIRIALRVCLFVAFVYLAYVFFYAGKKPSYLDYLLLVSVPLTAMWIDLKAVERKTGQKASLKRNLEFFAAVYKEMFRVLTFQRWRERRKIKRKNIKN